MSLAFSLPFTITNYKTENPLNPDSGFKQQQNGNTLRVVNMQMMDNHCHFIETRFIQLTKNFEAQ